MKHVTSKTFAVLSAAAGMTLAMAGFAGEADDAKFLSESIQSNIAETRMGELAEERAQSEAVREYGETLKEDHAKTMAKSVTLAKTMGASVPSEPAPAQKQHYDALAQLSGAEFDAAFVSHMVIAHQEAIAKYSAQASSADSETAELAEETLPTLREHLAKAQALQRGSRAGG